MNSKTIGLIALVAVVAVGGIYLLSRQNTADPVITESTETPVTTTGMRAEENMVVVTEQRPGTTIHVSTVYLAEPGYVVIHEDKNGTPGEVIGSSALLKAGENTGISVTVSRSTKDGDKLHAMLHSDTDGSGTFNTTDQPVQSRMGGPISGWFEISSSAGENVPVSI